MTTAERKCLGSADRYTVAWIAALAHERAAAEVLLDEEHDPPKGFVPNLSDQNTYSWGRMSGHNIVIASLPAGEYGLVSAADATGGLRASLAHIRIGLFVGIGAGVTGETPGTGANLGKITIQRDIRLGDVCVSQPDRTNGGVVQYDLQKRKLHDGRVDRELKGHLASPPRAVLSALTALQAKHERDDSSIVKFLEAFDKNKQTKRFKYPGAAHTLVDPLRDAAKRVRYSGASGGGPIDPQRQMISEGRVLYHEELEERDEPEIHYGTIAAGNVLLKNKTERDSILSWLRECGVDPICFEMEAAGLMNSFPSLIIRGICDYADENKNDAWQRYAAATAAAFAKEFLEKLSSREVTQAPSIDELLGAVEQIDQKVEAVHQNTEHLQDQAIKDSFVSLLHGLAPSDHSLVYATHLNNRMQGSGDWFLEHAKMVSWRKGESNLLYCPGVPGAGKTFMATGVIHSTVATTQDGSTVVIYYYFDHSLQSQQTLERFLATLLLQAVSSRDVTAGGSSRLRALEARLRNRLSHEELGDALIETLRLFKKAFVVVDAMDECNPAIRPRLLEIVRKSVKHPGISWLITSRDLLAIRRELPTYEELEIRTSGDDVLKYCREHAKRHEADLAVSEELLERIVNRVGEASGGVFLLVRLHIENVFSKTSVRDIKSALVNLPTDRNGAYEATILRIKSQGPERRSIACSALAWVSLMEEELSIEALQHALSVRLGDEKLDLEGIPTAELIISVCAGLLMLERRWVTRVRFSHFTTQEYMRATRDTWFPQARLDIAYACINYVYLPEVLAWRRSSGHIPKENDSNPFALYNQPASFSNPFPLYSHVANFETLARKINLCETEGVRNGRPISLRIAGLLLRALSQRNLRYTYHRGGPLANGIPTTAWHILACWGLVAVARDALKLGYVDDGDEDGNTPLHYAINAKQVAAVRILLQLCASPTAQNRWGDSPLHAAASFCQVEIISELLKTGADPYAHNVTGKTPLIRAMEEDFTEGALLLLARCKHEPSVSKADNLDLLLSAIYYRKADDARLLIKSLDLDFNARAEMGPCKGSTPLELAINQCTTMSDSDGTHSTVKLLLQLPSIDINLLDSSGTSILAQSCRLGLSSIVAELLSFSSIDVNIGTRTPLSYACEYGHEDIVDRLLQVATIDASIGPVPPYIYALRNGHDTILERLRNARNVHINEEAFELPSVAFNSRITDVASRLPSAIMEGQYSVIAEDQQSVAREDQQGIIEEDQQSTASEYRQSIAMEDLEGVIEEHQQSIFSEDRQNVATDAQSSQHAQRQDFQELHALLEFSYHLADWGLEVKIVRECTTNMLGLLPFERHDPIATFTHELALASGDCHNESCRFSLWHIISIGTSPDDRRLLGVGRGFRHPDEVEDMTHARQVAQAHVLRMVNARHAGLFHSGMFDPGLFLESSKMYTLLSYSLLPACPSDVYTRLKSLVAAMECNPETFAPSVRMAYTQFVAETERLVHQSHRPGRLWVPACAAAVLEFLAPEAVKSSPAKTGPPSDSTGSYSKLQKFVSRWAQCRSNRGPCKECKLSEGPYGYNVCKLCIEAGAWCRDTNRRLKTQYMGEIGSSWQTIQCEKPRHAPQQTAVPLSQEVKQKSLRPTFTLQREVLGLLYEHFGI